MNSPEAEELILSFIGRDGKPVFTREQSKRIVRAMAQEDIPLLIAGARFPPRTEEFSDYLFGINECYGDEVTGAYLMLCKPRLDYGSDASLWQILTEARNHVAKPVLESASRVCERCTD